MSLGRSGPGVRSGFLETPRIHFGNGSQLTFGGSGNGVVNGPIAVGYASASIIKDGAGTWDLSSSANGYSGSTTVSAGTLEITGRLGENGNYAGAITNAATLRFNSTATQTLSGVLSGAGSLEKTNTASLTLTGANTFTGLLLVDNGSVVLGGSGIVSALMPAEVNGGTFDINGKTQTISALNGTGGAVALGAGSLTVNNATTNTYAGVIGGSGSLLKSGAGNLILTGSNTYAGPTTISAGRLSVNGSLGNSAVTVQGSGELGGNGVLAGTVAVSGRLSPGNSIDVLTVGATSFASGGTFAYEVDSTDVSPGSLGTAADLVVVNGNLDIASGTLLELTDLAISPQPFVNTTTFTMINYTGSWNGGLFSYGGQPSLGN